MIGQLAENYPTSVFADIPKNMWAYGSGGIAATGALCGNVNGTQAACYFMGAPTAMKVAMFNWFQKTAIPTNACYVDYRTGTWTPSVGAWGTYNAPTSSQLNTPLNNAPKVMPDTVTCHGAHTKWKTVAGSWLTRYGSTASNDRCGKTTYDTMYKFATLVNEWAAGGFLSSFSPATVLDPTLGTGSTGCLQSGCHTGAGYPVEGVTNIKMTCTPCHSQRIGDGHNL